MVVNCDEFPDKIDGFAKENCKDDEFVDFCRTHDGALICISARNLETEVPEDMIGFKGFLSPEKWSPEGYGKLKGDDERRGFFVGTVDHTTFSDDNIVEVMKKLVRAYDDEDLLDDTKAVIEGEMLQWQPRGGGLGGRNRVPSRQDLLEDLNEEVV